MARAKKNSKKAAKQPATASRRKNSGKVKKTKTSKTKNTNGNLSPPEIVEVVVPRKRNTENNEISHMLSLNSNCAGTKHTKVICVSINAYINFI